jgi:hypothetical protein
MTVGGWIFMLCSVGFVLGLAGWSYWKTLTAPEPPDDDAP